MPFNLGCDVAVDLDQAVGKVVAQSPGLGDLGDAIGDQPRLMAVARSMEGQSGSHGGQVVSSIAVDSGPEHAAVEGAATDRAAGASGEHKRTISGGEVLAQQFDEKRRQGVDAHVIAPAPARRPLLRRWPCRLPSDGSWRVNYGAAQPLSSALFNHPLAALVTRTTNESARVSLGHDERSLGQLRERRHSSASPAIFADRSSSTESTVERYSDAGPVETFDEAGFACMRFA